MNTDQKTEVDLLGGSAALDALGTADTREAICFALDQLGSALLLPNFLLLHLHGPQLEVVSMLHNLPGSVDLQHASSMEAIKRALASRMPQAFVDQMGVAELGHAVATSWPIGMTTCVLVLGRATAWAASPAMDTLGVVSLASAAAVAALLAAQKAECPLTKRELECLVCAAGGSSAKETSLFLGLSPRTVEEYLIRCKERLRVRSTLAAARMAVHRGWVTFEEIDAASEAINRQYGAGQRRRRGAST